MVSLEEGTWTSNRIPMEGPMEVVTFELGLEER